MIATLHRPRIQARRASLAALALAATLSGCGELSSTLKLATEPIELYLLSPKSTFPADLPIVGAQIVVDEPTADGAVNTDRVAIKPNPLQVQYFPNGRWIDRAPLMVQRLLIESFENTGKVASVGASNVGLRSDYELAVDLREFQAELPAGAPPDATASVNVRLNIKVIRQPQGLIIGSRSFSAREQADTQETIEVIEAFDEALGAAMREAVDWTMDTIEADNGKRSYGY